MLSPYVRQVIAGQFTMQEDFRMLCLQIQEQSRLLSIVPVKTESFCCLLYTSDAADERSSVDLGGRRIIKKTYIPSYTQSANHTNPYHPTNDKTTKNTLT